jgi:NAD(P)-dependent dehydrogenase (short-subunit alcohol dehydrogenase family)
VNDDHAVAGHRATSMRLEGFAGRVALVTGAARGIGLEIARTLAAQGATTIATDLEAPEAAGMHGLALDVADPH